MPGTIYLYALFSYGVLFLALYIIFLYLIHEEYSYTFYQKAGADPIFRSMYRRYLRFQSVLKVDLMVAIVSTMSFKVSQQSSTYLLTFNLIIAIIAIIYFHIGRFGVSRENRPLVVVFWSLSSIQLVFYGYGVWDFIVGQFWKFQITTPEVALAALFMSSALTGLIVRIILLTLSVLAYLNFDRGLLDFEFLKGSAEERVPFNYQNVRPRHEVDAMTVDEVIKNTQTHALTGTNTYSTDDD